MESCGTFHDLFSFMKHMKAKHKTFVTEEDSIKFIIKPRRKPKVALPKFKVSSSSQSWLKHSTNKYLNKPF